MGVTQTHADSDCRLDAIVAVDPADVIGTAVFVEVGVIIDRRAVDPLALDRRRIDGRIVGCLERCIRHRHGPMRGGRRARRSRSATAIGGFEDGISHATGVAIENNVLDHTNFGAVRAADFGADDLAALNVASSRRGRRTGGLGLCIRRSNGQTREGQRCSH